MGRLANRNQLVDKTGLAERRNLEASRKIVAEVFEEKEVMGRKDYFVDREAQTEDVGTALQFAQRLLKGQGTSALWIVAMTKAQLDGDLATAIGDSAASTLKKGLSLSAKGKPVHFYTKLTLPRSAPGAIILAVHPDKKLMTAVDSLPGPHALVVVPWNMEDVSGWVAAHGPTDILSSTKVPPISLSNPVVIVALQSLLASINRSTGIIHPLDKSRAIDTFRALNEARIHVVPDEVRAWLIQQGLAPRHADDIAAVASSPGSYRRPGKSSLRSDIVSYWKTKAGI
jgi:hypothetical protein